jgi:D-xylose transport system substrate-binding protein
MIKKKFMKNARNALIIIIVIINLLMLSCKHKSGKLVGFMLPHMTIKRYPVERDVFTAKVRELGGDVIFMSADNDEEKQIVQVQEILKKNIDILVLDPVNRFRAAEMVRTAHNKGIQVISYDRLIANCDVDRFMTFDAYAIGNQMTQYALNKVPQGRYFILGGDKSDMNATMIDDALEKTLSTPIQAGKINIVYKMFIEKYSSDDAEFEIKRFLNLSGEIPDVILASSDMLALGAVNACKNSGLGGKVLITGQGGEIFACKNILKGYQAMTIYKPVKKMATLAAELSVKIAKGENVDDYFKSKVFNGKEDVPSTLLEVITVDAANLKNIIVADGMISEAELSE